MKSEIKNLIKQRRLVFALVCIVLAVGISVGAVFAYTQLMYRSDEQTISASNVYFIVNGKTFRDEVDETNLSFARGQSRDVDLAVRFESSRSESAVRYTVTLELDAANNALAPAIEVYHKTDGGYEFFGMLSELDGQTVSGYAVANEPQTAENFRFVYSPAASSDYEDKGFKLSASVTGEVLSSTAIGNVVYVNSLTATTFGSNAGRTVRLMDDITVDSLTIDAPVLLDLNGHTLTANGGVTVNYTGGSVYDAHGSLSGIVNSGTEGGVVGNLNISSCGDDLYVLGDDVTFDSVSFAENLPDEMLGGFFDAIEYNYHNRVVGRTYKAGDTVPLLTNLNYYLSNYNYAFALTSEVLDYSSESKSIAVRQGDDAPLLTNNHFFEITSGTASVSGAVRVRGSSAYAVADELLKSIPEQISSSLFFPTFDRASGLSLTWIVDDGAGGGVFDSSGAYLSGGADALSDWSDRTVRITLIAGNNDGEDANSDPLGNYYATSISRTAIVMNAERRTELLYSVGQIIVSEDENGEGSYAFADYMQTEYLQKTKLSAITVDLGGGDAANYIEVTENGTTQPVISVISVPERTSVSFDVTITFSYDDGKTFAFTKSLLVLGYTESVTLRNAQSTIQSWIDDTDYVKLGGVVYDLPVPSYLSGTGDLVEYTIPSEVNYLFVRDGEYEQNALGRFYRTPDGAYSYFSAYYKANADGTYTETEDRNGAYVHINGTYYPYGSGENCYDRKATFTVVPEKAPSTDTEVSITARLYRVNASGGKEYCLADGSYGTPTDANHAITYTVSLTVRGVLHNISTEIADSAVYSALLAVYDLNGDGFIGLGEAQARWIQVNGKYALSLDGTTAANDKRYDTPYISVASRNVANIKGLEYFTHARGYNLSGNMITDLSPLSALTEISLLNLSSNRITDISALSYLDSLTDLDLSNNNVTDVSALEYLRSLQKVNIASNAVSDFIPLSEHTNITLLDVRGNTAAAYLDARYAFATIYANNSGNSGFTFYAVTGSNASYSPSAALQANTAALRRLNEIGQVYKTIHLPVTVGGQTVIWEQGGTVKYITVGDPSGDRYDYTITTPAVDTVVTLIARIDGDGDATVVRNFTVLLLSDRAEAGSNEIWLETAEGVYVKLADVMPDKVLRSLLVSRVNSADDEAVTIEGNAISGLRVITLAEITDYANNFTTIDYGWAGEGITDLTGIGYFSAIIKEATLDLSYNSIRSLKPLGSLSGLRTLTLGGMEYDFNQLMTDGLKGLTTLTVYECYNLSDDDVLGGLYEVYLNSPNVTIYKDNASTAWDPYADIMESYVRTLTTFHAFMDQGDTLSIPPVDFKFYNHETPVTFSAGSASFRGNSVEDGIINNIFTSQISSNTVTITLNSAVARDATVYVKLTLSGNDGRGDITYSNYNIELFAEENTRFLFDGKPLSQTFTGYTVRTKVLYWLYSHSALSPAITTAKSDNTFVSLTNTDPLFVNAVSGLKTLTIDGTYESGDPFGGMQYLKTLTELTVNRDAKLGDGSALVNLTSLRIRYSFIDFASISVPLSNLQTLTITHSLTAPVFYGKTANPSYYELTYGEEVYLVPNHDYYLRFFPALTTLNLYESNGNGNQISDWTFLFGLLFDENGNFKQGTSGLTYNGSFVSHSLTTLRIYNNSNTYLATAVADSDKDVQRLVLGTLNSNLSNVTFNVIGAEGGTKTYASASGFGVATALFRSFSSSSSSSPSYYLQNATTRLTMSNVTYEFEVNPSVEYREFAPLLGDLGAKAGDYSIASYLDQIDQTVGSGVSLTLPLTTYALTGTDFGEADGAQTLFTRAFGIRWSIYGVPNKTINGINAAQHATLDCYVWSYDFLTAPSISDYKTASITVNLADIAGSKDYYIVVVGSIGEYYYDNVNGVWAVFSPAVTQYSFVYPLLIDAEADTSETSYANIVDTALRFLLFLRTADANYDGTLAPYDGVNAPDGTADTTPLKILWINYNNNGNASFYGGLGHRSPSTVFSGRRLYYDAITNLTGLKILQGLETVTIDHAPLSNIDDVSSLKNLTSLSITYCGVDYVPDLSETKVGSVNLSGNAISDLSGWKSCSATTLNLSINMITADQLAHLYDPQSGTNNISSVSTLNLAGNPCANEFAMVEWAYLLKNKTDGSAVTTMNGSEITAEKITALRNNIIGVQTQSDANVFTNFAYSTSESWAVYYARLDAASGAYVKGTSELAANTSLTNEITMTFLHENVRSFVNGTYAQRPTADMAFYPASQTCWVSSSVPVYARVTFDNGSSVSTKRIMCPSDNVERDVTDFDSYLLSYMFATYNATLSDDVYTFTNLGTAFTMDNTDNTALTGVRSLRGLNYFGFTSVTVNNNPRISELWSGEFASLTSLTLNGLKLTSKMLTDALDSAPNLTSLSTAYALGVDYTDTKLNDEFAKHTFTSLTLGGNSFFMGSDSVAQAYADLGASSASNLYKGLNIATLGNFVINSTYRSGVNSTGATDGMYRDAVAYFYDLTLQDTSKYNSIISKLPVSSGISLSRDGFVTGTSSNQQLKNLYAFTVTRDSNNNRTNETSGSHKIYRLLPSSVSYADLTEGAADSLRFVLPVSANINGKTYPYAWSLYDSTNGSSTVIDGRPANEAFLSGTNNNILTINQSTVTDFLRAINSTSLTSFRIRVHYELTVNGETLSDNVNIQITDVNINSSSSATEPVDYAYYVETDASGNCKPASEVFESGRFIEWIFNKSKSTNNYIRSGSDNYFNGTTTTYDVSVNMTAAVGWGIVATAATNHPFYYTPDGGSQITLGSDAKILTYDFCQRLFGIDFTNSIYSQGITSLEGIQVFANLKEFYAVAGNFTSVEPLESMSLSLFSYQVASGGGATTSYIADFTPLVNGSRETLEVFVYDSFAASIQLPDMSFLLAFKNMKQIFLFGSSPYDACNAAPSRLNLLDYIETPSFSYLVSALEKTDAILYIGSSLTGNPVALDNMRTYLRASSWAGHYIDPFTVEKLYAAPVRLNNMIAFKFLPKDGVLATDALAAFDNAGKRSDYVSVEDGYRLLLTGGSRSFVGSSSTSEIPTSESGRLTVSAKVPAVLSAGSLYAIDWKGSAHLKIGSYGITGSLTVGGVTYTADSLASYFYAEFAAFLAENEAAVYNAMNLGTFDVFVNVTLNVPAAQVTNDGVVTGYESQMYRTFQPIVMRAAINGETVERTLSVDISHAINNAT